MTKLLDQAIEDVRRLPEERQDEAAELLKSFTAQDPEQVRLSPGQLAEIARRLAVPEPDYADDAEVEAFYRNGGRRPHPQGHGTIVAVSPFRQARRITGNL